MSDMLDAVLAQNPIAFKATFDEAVKAAILRQGEAIQRDVVAKFSEAKSDEDDDKDDKDDKSEKDTDDKSDNSDKSDDSGKDDKSDEDDEDDESKKDNLTERTLSFEIGNPAAASKQLRSKGVAAASDPGDGKIVKVKVATPEDGRKVTAWLLDQGWSEKEVKQKYPELARLAKTKG